MHPDKWLRPAVLLCLATMLITSCSKIMPMADNSKISPVEANSNTDAIVPRGLRTPWVRGVDLPVPSAGVLGRYLPYSFTIGGKGYVGGGDLQNQLGNTIAATDVWAIDSATHTWSQQASFPGAIRTGAATFVLDGKGYVCTGLDANFDAVGENWQFDPIANTWTQKALFASAPRCYAVGASANGKGYVGIGNLTSDASGFTLRDWWEYDPIVDAWTAKALFPDMAGRDAAASFVSYTYLTNGRVLRGSGRVYVCGGERPNARGLKDLYKYDPSADTWTQLADLPASGRAYAVGMSLREGGVVATGWNGESSFNDVWKFNFTSNAWVSLPSVPNPRFAAAGFSIGNTLYIGGGLTGSGNDPKIPIDDFWYYTP